MQSHQQQPGNESENDGRPLGFYFLMFFLFFLTTFIGYQFGSVPGAIVGFLFATMVNVYALRIKFD